MTAHSNSIPELMTKYRKYMNDDYIYLASIILVDIIENLNDRILALEKEQILKPDGKDK